MIETYPWPHSNDQDWPSLLRLRPEDVGYDSQVPPAKGEKTQGGTQGGTQQSDTEGDPLVMTMNILLVMMIMEVLIMMMMIMMVMMMMMIMKARYNAPRFNANSDILVH